MSAMRYRLGQAVVIALLSALITACAVFAPLYDRAMQQAAVDVTLDNATTFERDLQLYGAYTWAAGERYDPARLAELIPTGLFTPAVHGRNAMTKVGPASAEGDLWWREGQCDHIKITAGSCPDSPRQILITDNESKAYGTAVGTTVTSPSAEVFTDVYDVEPTPGPTVTFTVVGTYEPADARWWQGEQLSGLAGVATSSEPRHDAWLTDESTFDDPTPPLAAEAAWVGAMTRSEVVDIDTLPGLATEMRALQRRTNVEVDPDDTDFSQVLTQTITSLPELDETVHAQVEQSRTTVPLLLVQLGLLGVIVLWLMLVAATDQRRPEVVVARLRGSGTAGARSILLRELLPAVLVGMIPGVAVALAGSFLVRTYVLPASPPFELPLAMVVALAIAAATLTLVTYVAVFRIVREPLSALLHRTSGRRPGWALGAFDAVAIAVTGACVVAFVTDSLTGPIALAAPALLSVLVGLVLTHVFAPVAIRLGRSLLSRGWLRSGLPLLESARSIATRRSITLVTVASALAVFSVCGVVIGERNRELAANQEAGAPLVAELQSAQTTAAQLERVHKTLADIDPGGHQVTPALRAAAPSGGAVTLAVEPEGFRRIALFTPGKEPSAEAWAALSAGAAREPIDIIAAGAPAEESDPTIVGLDGIEQRGKPVGTVSRIPGGSRDLALMDLDTATKLAAPDGDSSISLWFASADRALLSEVSDALAEQDMTVTETRTLSDVRRGLDESVATWSLWLGAVVGLAAVVIALLGLSVLSITGWRTRARDLASMTMAGVERRTVNRLPGAAQLVPVTLGAIAGAGCGLLGVVLTMPDIPLFTVAPEVDATDLSVPWPAALMTAAVCLLVLGAAAALLGRTVARAARLARLRETA